MTDDNDRAAIADIHKTWLRAEREGRPGDLAALCCEEIVVAPPDGPAVTGLADVDAFLRESAGPIEDLLVRDVSIEVIHGLAVLRARFATKPAGARDYIRGAHVWVLRPRWKIAYITWSLEPDE